MRALAKALGAPDELVMKVPTADLETLKPMRPDEDAFGVSYEQIDDFLEGKPVAGLGRAGHRAAVVRDHAQASPAPGAGRCPGDRADQWVREVTPPSRVSSPIAWSTVAVPSTIRALAQDTSAAKSVALKVSVSFG